MEQYGTRISKGNIEQIMHRNMTPAQIIQFLEDGATYRSFSDVLHSVYPGDDLLERLKQGMLNLTGEPLTGKEAESVLRNVRNWVGGSSMPQNREQLFKICFALGLGEAAANKVLARASEAGIHYRNPKELVYAYALRMGLSYMEAVSLNEELEKVYGPAVEAAAEKRKAHWVQWEKKYHEKRRAASEKYRSQRRQGIWSEGDIGQQMEEEIPTFLTQQVVHKFESITDEKTLRLFFKENSADLGVIHESAYEKFRRLLLTLEEPDDRMASSPYDLAGGEKGEEGKKFSDAYGLEKVADIYLRMNVPMAKNTRNFDYIQKAIKKNWPGTSDLQKMKARTIDVGRKTLLLLFIVTEDFLYSEDLQYSDQAEQDAAWFVPYEMDSPMDELEVTINKLNLFLEIYGMNQLDPGNPFDCLVLYAIAAEYGDGFLGDNFSDALGVLFQDI